MSRYAQLARAALCALPIAVAACADSSAILAPLPDDGAPYRGFDTSIYPGDAAMRAWRAPASPYAWTGYYLPAPCHSNTSWSGKRSFLQSMGWGTAVLYVGQQAWEGVATSPSLASAAEQGAEPSAASRVQQSATCSRTMLSGAQGTIEGSDAAAKAANEGFAAGTVIFLDIEYVSTVTQAMRDYYRSWVAQVIADGRYLPGIYCSKSNAATIYADVHDEFMLRRPTATPQFWIAGQSGFTVDRKPTDVGFAFANVWQGKLDTDERWNGVTLHIDVNVADSPSPSGR
ncbi:MAG: glycoside hydrolase domain-containing protein [Gemmatimonadaceae bacterium]